MSGTGGSRNITSPTTRIISVTVASDMSLANGSMSHESKSTVKRDTTTFITTYAMPQ